MDDLIIKIKKALDLAIMARVGVELTADQALALMDYITDLEVKLNHVNQHDERIDPDQG